MDFTLPTKTFLKQHFNLKKFSGHEKFLAIGASIAGGRASRSISLQTIKKEWSKTVLGIAYSDTYYQRAQLHGWVAPGSPGNLTITDKGITHLENAVLESLPTDGKPGLAPGLSIYTSGKTHSFDKFLRLLLAKATQEVQIADSYVDETIFDNLLDQIPDRVKVQLLYGNAWGKFSARVKRYKVQYVNFSTKNLPVLHDRFLLIDGKGYILGPSLKDAAKKSPALVVELGMRDSGKLNKFFADLWRQAK